MTEKKFAQAKQLEGEPSPLSGERDIRATYAPRRVAREYVAHRFTSELNRLLHDRQVAALQRFMDNARPKRILEIAPGPARLTRDLRPTGMLVCLEYNQAMIKQGRLSAAATAAWVCGNGFSLPFAPCFDLVYSFRFIRHFHDQDRARLYAEVRRVLVPGGYFIFDAVNESVSRPLREANPEEYPIYDKLYRPEELRAELAGAGLGIVSLQPVQKFYRLQGRCQTLLGNRAGWVNRLLIRSLEHLPRRHGLEWIAICRHA